jgi:hypothetical protein
MDIPRIFNIAERAHRGVWGQGVWGQTERLGTEITDA